MSLDSTWRLWILCLLEKTNENNSFYILYLVNVRSGECSVLLGLLSLPTKYGKTLLFTHSHNLHTYWIMQQKSREQSLSLLIYISVSILSEDVSLMYTLSLYHTIVYKDLSTIKVWRRKKIKGSNSVYCRTFWLFHKLAQTKFHVIAYIKQVNYSL